MEIIVIKRDGRKVPYDKDKIRNAIAKAFIEIYGEVKENSPNYVGNMVFDINSITDKVENEIFNILTPNSTEINIEDIQNIVENVLMGEKKIVAKAYITYRYKRSVARQINTTDETVMTMLGGTNEYWNDENSNKNPMRLTVQRDYLAGIVSTDITRRYLLPKDVTEAHDEGIIHFHDADYYIQKMHNCSLGNLDDMLQNGTVINGVRIEKPHTLKTAATIATQIITAITSNQYGGHTITLAHLAPFVRDSYNVYYNKYKARGLSEEQCVQFSKEDLHKEIEDAVQTFNYQINSMATTNGQAPFLSVSMYLGETEEYKEELAMLIEEFLKQRIEGMPNEQGVFVTQAFPKLLYFLEEDNINEDSKYFYLTKLAAECTAKRMVPDYVSVKMMKKLKGDVYPPMGCRSFLTPDRFTDKGAGNVSNAMNYEEGKHKYWGRLTA